MKTEAKKKPMLMAALKEERHQAQLRETYGITEKVTACHHRAGNADLSQHEGGGAGNMAGDRDTAC